MHIRVWEALPQSTFYTLLALLLPAWPQDHLIALWDGQGPEVQLCHCCGGLVAVAVVFGNFVLCIEEWKSWRTGWAKEQSLKQRRKGEFYLSREKKEVEKLPYAWEESQKVWPPPPASSSGGFYKDFISLLKGSWLRLCAIGLFMGVCYH
jgi:hypothetical protein